MSELDYAASWTGQEEAAGFVGKAISKIQSELDTINTETQALLARWKDSTSQAEYNARQTTWTKAANEVVRVLGDFQASLTKAAGISSDTEGAATTRLASR